MSNLTCLTVSIAATTVFGLVLCGYALFVETTKEHDSSYEALCDISEHMSCSKVFTSRYGRGFGLIDSIAGENSAWNQPNPVFGAALYTSLLILTGGRTKLLAFAQLGLCVIANLGSVYLASILYFVLHDFCVVCVTTYLVNLVLLVLTWLRYRAVCAMEAGHAPSRPSGPRKKKTQ